MSEFINFDDADDNDPQGEGEVIPHQPPSGERSQARRIALQILYEVDSTNHGVGDVLDLHLRLPELSKRVSRDVRRLVTGTLAGQARADVVISRFAPEWPLDQMAVIDRNILRLSIYEFAIDGRTPVGVAIDEAVQLARIFGADGATGFVNGVLGALADDDAALKELRPPQEQQGDDS